MADTLRKTASTKEEKRNTAIATSLSGTGAGGAALGAMYYGRSHKQPELAGERFNSHADLAAKLQSGDVILTGNPWGVGANASKSLIAAGTGIPNAYHSAVVDHITPEGKIVVVDHGPEFGYSQHPIPDTDIVSALRPKDGKGPEVLKNMQRRHTILNKVRDGLRARGVIEEDVNSVGRSLYDTGRLKDIGAREVLNLRGGGDQTKQIHEVNKRINSLEAYLPTYMDDLAKQVKTTGRISPDHPLNCIGGVCSTSMAEAGAPIGTRGNPSFAGPNDFLRSGNYDQIGHFAGDVTKKTQLYDNLAHATPHGLRGLAAAGIGAGVAGIVGGSMALARKKRAANAAAQPQGTPMLSNDRKAALVEKSAMLKEAKLPRALANMLHEGQSLSSMATRGPHAAGYLQNVENAHRAGSQAAQNIGAARRVANSTPGAYAANVVDGKVMSALPESAVAEHAGMQQVPDLLNRGIASGQRRFHAQEAMTAPDSAHQMASRNAFNRQARAVDAARAPQPQAMAPQAPAMAPRPLAQSPLTPQHIPDGAGAPEASSFGFNPNPRAIPQGQNLDVTTVNQPFKTPHLGAEPLPGLPDTVVRPPATRIDNPAGPLPQPGATGAGAGAAPQPGIPGAPGAPVDPSIRGQWSQMSPLRRAALVGGLTGAGGLAGGAAGMAMAG